MTACIKPNFINLSDLSNLSRPPNTKNNTYIPIQFGAGFFYGSSTAASTSNTSNFANKTSFTTGNLENGQYLISLSAELSANVSATIAGYRLYQNRITSPSLFTGSQNIQSTMENIYVSPYIVTTLTGGVYTYGIDYNRTGGTGTISFSNIQFKLHRINDSNTT